MNTALAVALLSGALAIGSAVLTAWFARGTEAMKARYAAEKEASDRAREVAVYGAPLAHAAFDLQSRLYNILALRFTDAYLAGGDARAQSYALENTTFLIGQYFCWSELTRQKIHFIELPTAGETRSLLRLQDRLQSEGRGTGFRPPSGSSPASSVPSARRPSSVRRSTPPASATAPSWPPFLRGPIR